MTLEKQLKVTFIIFFNMFFEDLKIYIMDVADVFVLLFETEFVQTNYKKILCMFFAGDTRTELQYKKSN